MGEDIAERVHADRRAAVVRDGELVPLTRWFGWRGRELKSPRGAVSGIGEMADGRWLVVDFRAFEMKAAT